MALWLTRAAIGVALALGVLLLTVGVFRWINPPFTSVSWAESRRLGAIERDWQPIEAISPDLARAVVAAEDSGFCDHWGIEMRAVALAMRDGSGRGASTITQQVVKNVFLWPERSWLRKGLEAGLSPLVEVTWGKRRILEVYLNIAEMGEGVFGAEAAARHHFGIGSAEISPGQAARLAAILPNPRERDPARPTDFIASRAFSVMDGAVTLARTGRDLCFRPR